MACVCAYLNFTQFYFIFSHSFFHSHFSHSSPKESFKKNMNRRNKMDYTQQKRKTTEQSERHTHRESVLCERSRGKVEWFIDCHLGLLNEYTCKYIHTPTWNWYWEIFYTAFSILISVFMAFPYFILCNSFKTPQKNHFHAKNENFFSHSQQHTRSTNFFFFCIDFVTRRNKLAHQDYCGFSLFYCTNTR